MEVTVRDRETGDSKVVTLSPGDTLGMLLHRAAESLGITAPPEDLSLCACGTDTPLAGPASLAQDTTLQGGDTIDVVHTGPGILAPHFYECNATSITLSPCDRLLAMDKRPSSSSPLSEVDSGLSVWDTSTGTLLWQAVPAPPATAMRFSPCGSWLAVVHAGTTRIWSTSGTPKADLPTSRHTVAASFARCGSRLLTAAHRTGQELAVWDIETTTRAGLLACEGLLRTVTVAAEGFVIAESEELCLCDMFTGSCLRRMEGHAYPIIAVAVDVTGTVAVSSGNDAVLNVWRLDSGCRIGTFTGHVHPARWLSLSEHGSRVASQASDLVVWEGATGARVADYPLPGPALGTALSRCGRVMMRVVSGGVEVQRVHGDS